MTLETDFIFICGIIDTDSVHVQSAYFFESSGNVRRRRCPAIGGMRVMAIYAFHMTIRDPYRTLLRVMNRRRSFHRVSRYFLKLCLYVFSCDVPVVAEIAVFFFLLEVQ